VAELYEILEYIANSQGMCLAKDVKKKALLIFENARKKKEFGNGRYARNLFGHALMRQAKRLLAMDAGTVTEEVAVTLIADDFEELRLSQFNKKGGPIGF
jgi:hypothetical protein